MIQCVINGSRVNAVLADSTEITADLKTDLTLTPAEWLTSVYTARFIQSNFKSFVVTERDQQYEASIMVNQDFKMSIRFILKSKFDLSDIVQLEKLKQDNHNLRQTYELLIKESKMLHENNTTIQKENQHLHQAYETIDKENKRLQESGADLSREYKALENANAWQRAEMENLDATFKMLLEENTTTHREEMATTHMAFEHRTEEYREQIAELEAHAIEMKTSIARADEKQKANTEEIAKLRRDNVVEITMQASPQWQCIMCCEDILGTADSTICPNGLCNARTCMSCSNKLIKNASIKCPYCQLVYRTTAAKNTEALKEEIHLLHVKCGELIKMVKAKGTPAENPNVATNQHGCKLYQLAKRFAMCSDYLFEHERLTEEFKKITATLEITGIKWTGE